MEKISTLDALLKLAPHDLVLATSHKSRTYLVQKRAPSHLLDTMFPSLHIIAGIFKAPVVYSYVTRERLFIFQGLPSLYGLNDRV